MYENMTSLYNSHCRWARFCCLPYAQILLGAGTFPKIIKYPLSKDFFPKAKLICLGAVLDTHDEALIDRSQQHFLSGTFVRSFVRSMRVTRSFFPVFFLLSTWLKLFLFSARTNGRTWHLRASLIIGGGQEREKRTHLKRRRKNEN